MEAGVEGGSGCGWGIEVCADAVEMFVLAGTDASVCCGVEIVESGIGVESVKLNVGEIFGEMVGEISGEILGEISGEMVGEMVGEEVGEELALSVEKGHSHVNKAISAAITARPMAEIPTQVSAIAFVVARTPSTAAARIRSTPIMPRMMRNSLKGFSAGALAGCCGCPCPPVAIDVVSAYVL